NRHGAIGLFDAALDLFEQFVFEGLKLAKALGEEFVLGAQVGQDGLVFAVHQPVIGVLSDVAVTRDSKGTWRDGRASGHCSILLYLLAYLDPELVLWG